jgi:hypothetical protein
MYHRRNTVNTIHCFFENPSSLTCFRMDGACALVKPDMQQFILAILDTDVRVARQCLRQHLLSLGL